MKFVFLDYFILLTSVVVNADKMRDPWELRVACTILRTCPKRISADRTSRWTPSAQANRSSTETPLVALQASG
jgi:hypothetical protein